MPETTINVDNSVFDLIYHAAARTDSSIKTIITALCRSMTRRKKQLGPRNSATQYQRRRTDSYWRTMHVSLSTDLYDQCCDLRKLRRRSVSALFCEEVARNIENIIRDVILGKTKDNNQDVCKITLKSDSSGYEYRVKVRWNKAPHPV